MSLISPERKNLAGTNNYRYTPRLRRRLSELGAIAQLGERNTGSVEVGGSIPPGSTKPLFHKRLCFISIRMFGSQVALYPQLAIDRAL